MSGYDTPFQNLIRAYNGGLVPYDPFSRIKAEGLHISDSFRDHLLSYGERHLYRPYEPISAQSFMRFVRTGDRSAMNGCIFQDDAACVILLKPSFVRTMRISLTISRTGYTLSARKAAGYCLLITRM